MILYFIVNVELPNFLLHMRSHTRGNKYANCRYMTQTHNLSSNQVRIACWIINFPKSLSL